METTIAQALVLVLGLAAGAAWPREARPRPFTQETFVNLANGVLLYPVRLLIGLTGVNALDRGLIDLSEFPTWFQFIAAFIALDFTRYWVHYADHRIPLLWKFHRVHHSCEALDSSSGFRMHLVDFLQLTAIPIFLFGILFRVSHGWVLPAALIVGIVADAAEHANVRFTLDTWWRRAWFQAFNNPLFHSWHHTRDGRLIDGNYANALPLWDRVFGTDVTRDQPPELYGLEAKQALDRGLVGLQLLRPRQ